MRSAFHLVLSPVGAGDEVVEGPVRPEDEQQDGRRVARLRPRPVARLPSTATASSGRSPPHAGHRFNPDVVVLDPYATSISGAQQWGVPDIPNGDSPHPVHAAGADRDADEFDWEDDFAPGHAARAGP